MPEDDPERADMIKIGVTGHRILAEVEKIEAGIAEALRGIERKFPGEPLAVVSCLAEGADRLVARQVLAKPNARLIVPLPLPESEYLQDFPAPRSQQEFLALVHQAAEVIHLPPAPSRDEAYEAAGHYVVDHCDVLLAVWDGQGAQGMGGTGGIVAEARRRKLPLAWVHAGNRRPGTQEPTTLGDEQGRVTYENFPPLTFISAHSPDYPYAREIFAFLVKNGVRAFFSDISLPKLGKSDYREAIDEALDEADHMIVVASRAEHLKASWVKAEWGLFINEKRSGRKTGNILTVTAGTLQPEKLPPSLRYYEVIPLEPDHFDKVLLYVGGRKAFIGAPAEKSSQTPQGPEFSGPPPVKAATDPGQTSKRRPSVEKPASQEAREPAPEEIPRPKAIAAPEEIDQTTTAPTLATPSTHKKKGASALLGRVGVGALVLLVVYALYYFTVPASPPDSDSYFTQGLLSLENKDYDRAISSFSEALNVRPNWQEAYLNRGQAYAQKGLYDQAVADFNAVLQKNPKDVRALFHRGEVFLNQNQKEKAIEDIDQVFLIDSEFAKEQRNSNLAAIYYQLGDTYSNKNRHEDALDYYNKAISLSNVGFWFYYNDRGVIYGKIHQYDKAIEDFNQALRLNQNELSLWNKARFCEISGRFQEAIDAYQAFIYMAASSTSKYQSRVPEAKQKIEALKRKIIPKVEAKH